MNDLAKHTVAVTDAMFKPREIYLTPTQKIDTIIAMAKSIEKMLSELERVYIDHRGSINEALRNAGDIIDNIEGHKKDIAKGLE